MLRGAGRWGASVPSWVLRHKRMWLLLAGLLTYAMVQTAKPVLFKQLFQVVYDDHGFDLIEGYTFSGEEEKRLPLKPEVLNLAGEYVFATWVRTTSDAKQTLLCISEDNKWAPYARGFGLTAAGLPFFDVLGVDTVEALVVVNDGAWHHIAFVYNNRIRRVMTIYVDGQLVVSSQLGDAQHPPAGTSTTVTIANGIDAPHYSYRYTGELHRMIWRRNVYAKEDVRALLAETAPAGWEHSRAVVLVPGQRASSLWCPSHEPADPLWAKMFCTVGPRAIDAAASARGPEQRLRPSTTQTVIGIGVPVSTRGLEAPSFESLVLFSTMLPAMLLHLEPGYEFWVYLAHDDGDPWFEVEGRAQEVQRWFEEHVTAPAQARGITVQMALVHFKNDQKKPGPVFNFMMRAMHQDGADYMYRVNDDTIFSSPFADIFVKTLLGYTPPNVGVVGPMHQGGAEEIITHDFVHRTHLDILGLYYPTRFKAWYMDDWISCVYGKANTKKHKSVLANHTMAHGVRYDPDSLDVEGMGQELIGGRMMAIDFLDAHGGDASALRASPIEWIGDQRQTVFSPRGLGQHDLTALARDGMGYYRTTR